MCAYIYIQYSPTSSSIPGWYQYISPICSQLSFPPLGCLTCSAVAQALSSEAKKLCSAGAGGHKGSGPGCWEDPKRTIWYR